MRIKKIFNKEYSELTGCIHVHTKYSFDCDVTLRHIIDLSRKEKIDYVTITDHVSLKAHEDPDLKDCTNPLFIVGTEIHDLTQNHHLLVFNTDKVMIKKDVNEYLNYYKNSGCITFAAHPNEKRRTCKFRKYEWLEKSLNSFDGLEIWNYTSDWLSKVNPKLNGLFCLLFPDVFVRKPQRKNLNFLDDLNNKGLRKAAIGSIDAHGTWYSLLGIRFRILSHRKLFKTIRTNVLLRHDELFNNPDEKETLILKALKKGNSYICNYKLGIPYNFYGGISDGVNSAIFGEEIKLAPNMKYFFNMAQISDVFLYHNGKKKAFLKERLGFFEITEPGHYRLEISRFKYGWIYTNPIFVIE